MEKSELNSKFSDLYYYVVLTFAYFNTYVAIKSEMKRKRRYKKKMKMTFPKKLTLFLHSFLVLIILAIFNLQNFFMAMTG